MNYIDFRSCFYEYNGKASYQIIEDYVPENKNDIIRKKPIKPAYYQRDEVLISQITKNGGYLLGHSIGEENLLGFMSIWFPSLDDYKKFVFNFDVKEHDAEILSYNISLFLCEVNCSYFYSYVCENPPPSFLSEYEKYQGSDNKIVFYGENDFKYPRIPRSYIEYLALNENLFRKCYNKANGMYFGNVASGEIILLSTGFQFGLVNAGDLYIYDAEINNYRKVSGNLISDLENCVSLYKRYLDLSGGDTPDKLTMSRLTCDTNSLISSIESIQKSYEGKIVELNDIPHIISIKDKILSKVCDYFDQIISRSEIRPTLISLENSNRVDDEYFR